MTQTALSRWTKTESYHPSWASRSETLLDLVAQSLPGARTLSYSEYGCGPNRPFSRAVDPGCQCFRYDIKAWDEECRVVDLNNPHFEVEKTDVAVLSGVLEYMNVPSRTLVRLSQFHRYALVSYYPIRASYFWTGSRISEVRKRAEKNGWRNHLSFDVLLQEMSTACFPVSIREYDRQVLMLLEFHA